MFNYCLIGKGFIFSRHVEAIQKTGGKVVLTCDIDKSKNPDFTDYQKMFKSEKFKKEVDAVVICTPNYLHGQQAKDALKTGKKVLVEKPIIIDNDFSGLESINAVLQLRYHSLNDKIKIALDGNNKIGLVMRVCRDEKWWDSWRGIQKQSGGILLGLAVHMFDYLIFMLGNKYEIIKSSNSRKKCTGIIKFPTAEVNYYVEVLDNEDKKNQTRKFIINGDTFELCDKDNLSFAGYHDQVYENFIKGNGIPLSEAKKSIELILKL